MLADMSTQIDRFAQDIDCWVHTGTDDMDSVVLVVLEKDSCQLHSVVYFM